jgi:phage terminase large subunit-like protein
MKVAKKWIHNASDRLAVERGCYVDLVKAQRPVTFIESFCRQSKGRWAGEPLTLLPWQRDFVMRLFGWRRPDGRRRFTTCFLEVAKKNGKSTLAAALSLFLILADGEGAPEVYLNAVDRSQADLVFEESARMVDQSPDIASRLRVTRTLGRIVDPVGYGKIQKNSADAPSKDGVNASASIFDELHRFKSRALWEVFEYAGAAREQPLRLVITTAGEEEAGPWFEQRDYSEKVNDGTIPETSHLGVVYRALPDDDLDDPATWRKANPSLGVTISEEDFARDLRKAKETPTEWANFMRLRLNIVIRGDQAFVSAEQWDACNAHAILTRSEPIWGGLDLSSIDDITALVTLAGDPHTGFDVEAKFWLPEEGIVALERKHQVPYRAWAEEGLITLTSGNVIDYQFVRSEINLQAAERDLRKLFVDPYNATKLAGELKEQDGLPVEYIRQGFLSLSAPTKELLRLIASQRIRHGGNPILKWHACNAIAEQDAAGNLKLSKSKSKRKIDGMAALVNAIAAATSDIDAGASVYESRGALVF